MANERACPPRGGGLELCSPVLQYQTPELLLQSTGMVQMWASGFHCVKESWAFSQSDELEVITRKVERHGPM